MPPLSSSRTGHHRAGDHLSHRAAILGTVGLATGLMLGTEARSALAAEKGHRSPSVASARHNDGPRHDSYWKYYGCLYERCDAEEVSRRLKHEGFRCKIERKNNRWCVYIRRDS